MKLLDLQAPQLPGLPAILLTSGSRNLKPETQKACKTGAIILYLARKNIKGATQYLKQSDVDDYFIQEICRLNQDFAFWAGMQTGSSLHEYLIRYLLMYVDYDFVPRSWVEDYIRNFINSRRDYHPSLNAARATLKEASSIFSESKEVLKQMSRQQLVRLFRRRAQDLHPDKGGAQEKFVRLTQAYHMLLKTKK